MTLTSKEPQLLKLMIKCFNFIKKHISFNLILFISSYIILTNAVFWFFEYKINAYRYWILLDYLWILPLLLLKNKYSKILFFILFIIIYFVDVLYWTKQFFPILNLEDFLNFLTYIPYAPKTYLFFILFGVFNLIFLCFTLLKLEKYTTRSMILPFIFLYAIFQTFFFDYRGVNYSDHLKTQGYWGSMYETHQNLKFNRNLHWREASIPDFTPTLYPSALKENLNLANPPEKILFILNESWGSFAIDAKIDKEVISPLLTLENSSLISYGENHVGNGTIMAEIREMCSLTSDSPNFKLGDHSKFNDCIPRQFRRQGYFTASYHGADAGMYARNTWYPSLGFSHPKFYPDLKNLERCTSFPGACDKNILVEIAELNQKSDEKQFIYWLTLNSHHPYSEKDIDVHHFDCKLDNFKNRQEACRNLNLQFQLFNNLANSIKKGNFKNTTIIVVGDHMPPLVSDKEKDSFKKDTVPFIHIKVSE
ncbi:sulfatase-like hydrolase/transferase [Acinetobacter sp. 256-1]|uniref:sulfatase-like hydrolase/transferase n=1 Tax=Acinetobacter sp. 256-1 TaxID=2746721 RepID=UPI002576B24F|nr:sulfatase-like hydrolase/transferase [Acinetobacter sp. 256-1]MDM1758386.1 sulfatase-like hydrolase/transferase [Acinetobacter sp. 256-1]